MLSRLGAMLCGVMIFLYHHSVQAPPISSHMFSQSYHSGDPTRRRDKRYMYEIWIGQDHAAVLIRRSSFRVAHCWNFSQDRCKTRDAKQESLDLFGSRWGFGWWCVTWALNGEGMDCKEWYIEVLSRLNYGRSFEFFSWCWVAMILHALAPRYIWFWYYCFNKILKNVYNWIIIDMWYDLRLDKRKNNWFKSWCLE